MALAACGVLAVSLLPLAVGSTVFLSLLAGWAAAAALLFGNGYWFSLALPLAGAVPPVLCLMLVRQMFDRRQAKLQVMARQALGLFHAPALSRRIADDPGFLKSPRAQDAAILFVDLGGFTGTSERLGPAATRDLLKAFHQLVVEEADRLGGVVLDFMGDGAMIGFGIPDPGAEDAEQALRASFGLASRIRSWIADSPECASLKGMRVGVHCGPIILSRLGHERQQQISASGDCVNVASRLMEVGKAHGAAITASSRLLSRAGRTASDLPRPDVTKPVKIRGRRGDIEVVMWMPA
nr:adenylate/guanylate cyclase domain-containing protein [Leisingera sp. ANG59]